ncbi:pyridoxal phosphate phosphatase PHOSPHO2-like [Thrips palmi]|uniref:Pyridoxal phosphate phosphatase PHOSPHO2-like n=1 Tax=Thrips palmi TaxID=161013 RepID=A0A6P8Y4K0_THRPL|nr:pyridoxal phosphate phosphatase PHOSPHO2-like [Thrips palmi]
MVKKLLIAFDFDHTIIDGNSDTVVRQLLQTKPPECKLAESWTTYMQNVFNLLHQEGATESLYLDTIANIPPTPGMMDLLQFLDNPEVEIIIISDSNSIFIQTWLDNVKLSDSVHSVYTNQAVFDSSGLLNITMYHSQNWCDKCPENLCKGSVLDEHLKKRHEEGVTFSSVAYVGDGRNDYCPSTKLSRIDHVFPRKGFSLEKLLTDPQTDEESKKKIMANVCVWASALEIKEKLSEIV